MLAYTIAHAVLLYGWRGLAVYFVLGVWRYLLLDKLTSSHAFLFLNAERRGQGGDTNTSYEKKTTSQFLCRAHLPTALFQYKCLRFRK